MDSLPSASLLSYYYQYTVRLYPYERNNPQLIRLRAAMISLEAFKQALRMHSCCLQLTSTVQVNVADIQAFAHRGSAHESAAAATGTHIIQSRQINTERDGQQGEDPVRAVAQQKGEG